MQTKEINMDSETKFSHLLESVPIRKLGHSETLADDYWKRKTKITLDKVESLRKQLIHWLGYELTSVLKTKTEDSKEIDEIKESYKELATELAWLSIKIGIHNDVFDGHVKATLLSKKGVERCNDLYTNILKIK